MQDVFSEVDDNSPLDKYRYYVTVNTGNRYNAGTTAVVSLALVGAEGESDVHIIQVTLICFFLPNINVVIQNKLIFIFKSTCSIGKIIHWLHFEFFCFCNKREHNEAQFSALCWKRDSFILSTIFYCGIFKVLKFVIALISSGFICRFALRATRRRGVHSLKPKR